MVKSSKDDVYRIITVTSRLDFEIDPNMVRVKCLKKFCFNSSSSCLKDILRVFQAYKLVKRRIKLAGRADILFNAIHIEFYWFLTCVFPRKVAFVLVKS